MPSSNYNIMEQSVAIDLAIQMKLSNESKNLKPLSTSKNSFSLRSSVMSLVPSRRSLSSLATSSAVGSADLSVPVPSKIKSNLITRAAITAATDGLAGKCAALEVFDGSSVLGYVSRTSNGYNFVSALASASSFYLESTLLSRYQLIDSEGSQAYMSVINWVMPGSSYGDRADWTFAATSDGNYTVTSTLTGQYLGSFLGTLGAGSSTSTVSLTLATGCYTPPDVPLAVTGTPSTSISSQGTIVGVMDMHMHLTAGYAFGGEMHCGDAWALGGMQDALPSSCDGHKSDTIGALLQGVLGGTSITNASGYGYPSFSEWPTYNSVLHEQAYFRGIERAYLSGVRVINALLVANRVICDIFPYKDMSCGEMDQIRAQYTFLTQLQDYVDALSGGSGLGWFRIVTTPAQVRTITAAGKLAVLIGVENSEIFGCSQANATACTEAVVDAGLDELQAMGVTGFFPVHKFDNAFGGTRMDPGAAGVFINLGNLVSSGHWWELENCTSSAVDQPQSLTSNDFANFLDFGITSIPDGTILPVYHTGPACNIRGLTDIGAYLVQQMIQRGMIVHIDHMSVKTANMTLNLLQTSKYPGTLSEHSWADYAMVDRVLAVGGVVGIYGFNSTEFVQRWQLYRSLPHGSAVTAIGLGSDVNGLAVQPPPRTDSSTNPFVYPFTTLTGITAARQSLGTRTYDINNDGVAFYGLYAEWLVDSVNIAGTDGVLLKSHFLNGAEAYVSMWEKARATQNIS
ncbi:hypothetical protein HK100_008520 [Physocladia obscura]|uniref:Uncharacterized protein n=1 Tax=Physocladia obscura TaxID=109957 RepID=A0AAD5T464_9FUNG|nr:hypothetical protein HK100_008520 [Physocladia obscura]